MKTTPVLAFTLACTLAVPACAIDLPVASGRVEVPVNSVKQLRFSATLRQQYDFSCGSAALATLLTHHYGHPVSEQQVFEQMYLRGDRAKIHTEGFSLLDMQRYLASLGYRADGFDLPLQRLLDARLPAIVLVAEKGYQHFVVIKGVGAGRVLLGDPAGGTRSLPRERFETIWRNGLLFVIHGHAGPVAFNRPEDWRAAPYYPLAQAVGRDSAADLSLSKLGPGDF
jgi:uncharacterized protein